MRSTKVLLVGAVAAAAALGLSVPAGAGPRQSTVVPGATTGQDAYLITDAPFAIRVGSSYTEVPVVVGTRFDAVRVAVSLVDPRSGEVAFADQFDSGTRAALRPSFTSADIRRYGTYRWDIESNDRDFTEHDLSVDAVVKANTLLGLGVRRSGSQVTLTVATRQWNNAVERYQGWGGRGVYVQRLAADGSWQNVAGITTNSAGNGTKVLGTGAGTYRAYDKDTATAFGSTTAGVRA